jgi:lipopolysaccharide export LptBFGC system permease protein LptF
LGFVELPVRVTTAWVIFKMYTDNELGIGTASMGIWLINVVLPALIGSLLVLNIKIIKEK